MPPPQRAVPKTQLELLETSQSTKLGDIAQLVSALDGVMQKVKTEVNPQRGGFPELSAATATLEARVSGLQSHLSDARESIEILEDEAGTLEGDLRDLKSCFDISAESQMMFATRKAEMRLQLAREAEDSARTRVEADAMVDKLRRSLTERLDIAACDYDQSAPQTAEARRLLSDLEENLSDFQKAVRSLEGCSGSIKAEEELEAAIVETAARMQALQVAREAEEKIRDESDSVVERKVSDLLKVMKSCEEQLEHRERLTHGQGIVPGGAAAAAEATKREAIKLLSTAESLHDVALVQNQVLQKLARESGDFEIAGFERSPTPRKVRDAMALGATGEQGDDFTSLQEAVQARVGLTPRVTTARRRSTTQARAARLSEEPSPIASPAQPSKFSRSDGAPFGTTVDAHIEPELGIDMGTTTGSLLFPSGTGAAGSEVTTGTAIESSFRKPKAKRQTSRASGSASVRPSGTGAAPATTEKASASASVKTSGTGAALAATNASSGSVASILPFGSASAPAASTTGPDVPGAAPATSFFGTSSNVGVASAALSTSMSLGASGTGAAAIGSASVFPFATGASSATGVFGTGSASTSSWQMSGNTVSSNIGWGSTAKSWGNSGSASALSPSSGGQTVGFQASGMGSSVGSSAALRGPFAPPPAQGGFGTPNVPGGGFGTPNVPGGGFGTPNVPGGAFGALNVPGSGVFPGQTGMSGGSGFAAHASPGAGRGFAAHASPGAGGGFAAHASPGAGGGFRSYSQQASPTAPLQPSNRSGDMWQMRG